MSWCFLRSGCYFSVRLANLQRTSCVVRGPVGGVGGGVGGVGGVVGVVGVVGVGGHCMTSASSFFLSCDPQLPTGR